MEQVINLVHLGRFRDFFATQSLKAVMLWEDGPHWALNRPSCDESSPIPGRRELGMSPTSRKMVLLGFLSLATVIANLEAICLSNRSGSGSAGAQVENQSLHREDSAGVSVASRSCSVFLGFSHVATSRPRSIEVIY